MVTEPIRAESVAYGFPNAPLPAVDEVTLVPRAGEVTVLAGPNGAGKSTVLRMLAGLLEPSAGGVVVADQHGERPLAALDPRARARHIAFIPQALDAVPATTVESFVAGGRYAYLGFWRAASERDRAAIDNALQQCELTHLRHRDLWALSGGERQRTLVARAAAQDSRVILCDEPTASLDIEHALRVCDLLADLASEGRAVVLVTHALELAVQYAERIVLLQEGRIVADGSATDVMQPKVLEPVYGKRIHIATLPDGQPIIVAKRQA